MMPRRLALGCMFLLAPFLIAKEPPLPFDSGGIDRLAEQALREWGTPGLALAIVRNGETVHLKGYGTKVVGRNDPVTPDTLFPLASCTKAFTSALLAGMNDDGTLRWDDPVRKHLPSFHVSEPHADALFTIRDLLNHRSGFAGTEHDLLWYRAPWSGRESVRRIAELPESGPFRGAYRYSSLLYMAAGQAAENRSRSSWPDLVRDKLCTPIGMKTVAFTTAEARKVKDRATGHQRTPAGGVDVMPEYHFAEANPSGSLQTTARDLAEWVKFHLANGVAHGRRIVSADSLTETKTPQTVMPKDETIGPVYPDSHQVSYAMGWAVYDYRGLLVVAHGGIIDGFRAQVTLLPEKKIGIVLLNNLHKTKMNIALGNAIIDQLTALPAKDWNRYFLKVEADEREAKRAAVVKRNAARTLGTSPSLPLARYDGRFSNPAYGIGTITEHEGKLVWKWGSLTCPLEHFEHDTFRIVGGFLDDQLVEFAVKNGVVSQVHVMGVNFQRE